MVRRGNSSFDVSVLRENLSRLARNLLKARDKDLGKMSKQNMLTSFFAGKSCYLCT